MCLKFEAKLTKIFQNSDPKKNKILLKNVNISSNFQSNVTSRIAVGKSRSAVGLPDLPDLFWGNRGIALPDLPDLFSKKGGGACLTCLT